jgi:uncharacterized coiled-coil DUF342 family protein
MSEIKQPETPGQQTETAIKVLKDRRFVLARDLAKPVALGDEIFAEEWREEVAAIDAVLAQLTTLSAEIERLKGELADKNKKLMKCRDQREALRQQRGTQE